MAAWIVGVVRSRLSVAATTSMMSSTEAVVIVTLTTEFLSRSTSSVYFWVAMPSISKVSS